MISKSTWIKYFAAFLVAGRILTTSSAQAQSYCSPVFAYGCYSWHNNIIHLDSINWAIDIYNCSLYDYTMLSTTLVAGTSYSMQVTNGDWCGCGVWIDLNQDYAFDTTENFFHLYMALETNTYNIPITIPLNVSSGTYRMRVVAGWGSDCYNPGNNGYGPCGLYQYGNFDDFTIHVTGVANQVTELSSDNISLIEVNPNPVANSVTVSIKDFPSHDAKLQLTDVTGKIILSRYVMNQTEVMDMGELSEGIYFLSYRDGLREQTIKLVK